MTGIVATGIVFVGPLAGSFDSAQAGIIVRIGDDDNFGGWPGNTSSFDNRDAGELAATDGAQFTDRSLMLAGGTPVPFTLTGLYPAGELVAATVTISGAGFDVGNTYTVSIHSLAGDAVLGTFPTSNDPFGKTIFDDVSVPSNILNLLDNALSPVIEITASQSDSFAAIDYVSAEISMVPEPTTLTASLMGLLTLGACAGYRHLRARSA